MQLMTFNSLLMFDIVFMFFLFLVGVTCLVYYLPTGKPHRPLAQTASILDSERCRYRHRHMHLYSQKNINADKILTDDGSESEEDIESDGSEDASKNEIKRQHDKEIDTKEMNFIEKNEIELVKFCNKGCYPLSKEHRKNPHNHKILYHCCPPCNLSDCEHYYISGDKGRNIAATGIGGGVENDDDDTISSSRLTYLDEVMSLKYSKKMGNIHKSWRNNNYIDCKKIPSTSTIASVSSEIPTPSSSLSSSSLSIAAVDGEYVDECCSTTSVDIVLAEGEDDDNNDVIIYDSKKLRCSRTPYRNKASAAATFREHLIVVKETEGPFYHCNYNNFSHQESYNNHRCSSSNCTTYLPFIAIPPPPLPSPSASPLSLPLLSSPPGKVASMPPFVHQPYCCHVKAKSDDIKDCVGPIADV